MTPYNILIKSFAICAFGLLCGACLFATGCSTSVKITDRYKTPQPPEYQLVDTRFGSIEIHSLLEQESFERNIQYSLYKNGCDIRSIHHREAVTQIAFERPGARGKITITAKIGEDPHALHTYSVAYRVNISQYPSTADQDYQVNLIADDLAATLKRNDLIQCAFAGSPR